MTFRLAGLTVSNCCDRPGERDRGIYVLCSSSRFNVRSEHVDCRVSQTHMSQCQSIQPKQPLLWVFIPLWWSLIVSSHVIQFHGQQGWGGVGGVWCLLKFFPLVDVACDGGVAVMIQPEASSLSIINILAWSSIIPNTESYLLSSLILCLSVRPNQWWEIRGCINWSLLTCNL